MVCHVDQQDGFAGEGILMAFVNEGSIETIDHAVWTEFRQASERFPKFNSPHEGFSVLKEEVDELWEAVKLNNKNPARAGLMQKEAVQVAAMAIRFLHDVSYNGRT